MNKFHKLYSFTGAEREVDNEDHRNNSNDSLLHAVISLPFPSS